jgi:hypothetical protein
VRWALVAYWLSVSIFSVFAFLALMCIYLVLNVPGLLFAAGMYLGVAYGAAYNVFREGVDG